MKETVLEDIYYFYQDNSHDLEQVGLFILEEYSRHLNWELEDYELDNILEILSEVENLEEFLDRLL